MSEGRVHHHRTDAGMVKTERMMAAVLALVAAVLGVIGLLRGFGMIGTEGVDIPGLDAGGLQAVIQSSFWEGIVWMLPALAFGVIAWSYASGRAHSTNEVQSPMRAIALTMVAVTIALSVISLIAGFGIVRDGAEPTDGVLWGMTALLSALLASAAYSAIPSPVPDEDYLVALVDSRVGTAMPPSTTAPPSTEHLR